MTPRPLSPWIRFTALLVLAASGCRRSSEGGNEASGSATTPSPAPSRRPVAPPLSKERVEIRGGAFRAGSVPGEPGRRPEIEPRSVTVELGPFQIDRLPFPNEPGRPPLTGVSREEARSHCDERGGRLCTELEWERACKGPDSDRFATGEQWDPRCETDPASCASGFDVLGMGAIREWTASDVVFADETRKAAIRGAAPKSPSHARRCAHRRALDVESRADDLGFRCCKGAPNAALVPEPRETQTFVKTQLSAERLSALLAADPHTKSVSEDVKFFREPDAANTVVDRGPGDRKGFLFTVSPLLWNPVAGARFLVVSARSGERTSFVTVFHVLEKDDYRLASSFIMKDEVGPVALAYNGYIRPRLHFSTCWGCPGETGKILYRDPDSAVVLQP